MLGLAATIEPVSRVRRDGRALRIVEKGKLLPEPVGGVPVVWSKGQGGLLDVAVHPDYATNAARVANRKGLREAIVSKLSTFERLALLAKLEHAGVPASPINTIADMFADPQTTARGIRLDLDDGHGNSLPSVRAPIVLSATPLAYDRPSPRLGEHTAEILAELVGKP